MDHRQPRRTLHTHLEDQIKPRGADSEDEGSAEDEGRAPQSAEVGGY